MRPRSLPALMAIGGALRLEKPGCILREFYLRSGGEKARIVIIPAASEKSEAGEMYRHAFCNLGLEEPPQILEIQQRRDAYQPDCLVPIASATGIFLTGGNQVRLTALIGGTPAEDALQVAYRRGALIAGTSAGAAALSAVMLAFGRSGPTPRQGNAQFVPGLGFTSRLIIDQHFRQRDRLGRLLFAVANHPGILGIGIDENTAVVIEGDILTVFGENAVTIVDGSELQATSVADVLGKKPVAMSGARVHVLTEGSTFDLESRQATIPEKRLVSE